MLEKEVLGKGCWIADAREADARETDTLLQGTQISPRTVPVKRSGSRDNRSIPSVNNFAAPSQT